MKQSGRRNSKGRSTPQRQNRGGTTATPSDDKPSKSRSRQTSGGSEAGKLESRKKLPANRTKVKPIGTTAKPRRKAA